MARNFVDDALSDLIFENVNDVKEKENVKTSSGAINYTKTIKEQENVETKDNVNNVKTFERKGNNVIAGYENEPEVSFCINLSLEGKMFITTESRRLGMKIKEYLTKIIVEDNNSEPLSRNESFQICKKCKLEDKRVSRYTLPMSVAEMFENNARKNMMNKTEYIYYIISKML